MKYRVKRHEVIQPLDPSYRLIPLTQGQNAIVDTEDFEWISQWNWYALWVVGQQSFVAIRVPGILMSRAILKCGPGKEVDHRNFNSLDNRKDNLRECNDVQNSRHRRVRSDSGTGLKGVHFVSKHPYRPWRAKISVSAGRRIHLGYFATAEEAGRAYDKAAKRYHGEFAQLNFSEKMDYTVKQEGE